MIPDSEKLSVLIVCGEDFTCSVLESAAEESGLFGTIITATDGYEALAQLSDAALCHALPDVVLTELDMSPLNGVQFTRELRQHSETRRVFVAILSPTTADLDRAAAETAGADFLGDYTIAMVDLLATIRTIADRAIHQGDGALPRAAS